MSILVSLRILSVEDVEHKFERFPGGSGASPQPRHYAHRRQDEMFSRRANALYYLPCEQIAMNIRCVRLILSARRHCGKAVSDGCCPRTPPHVSSVSAGCKEEVPRWEIRMFTHVRTFIRLDVQVRQT